MDTPGTRHASSLATPAAIEQAVLDRLQSGIVLSGHALREALLRAGCDKAMLVATMQAMVVRGLIERLRVDEADGRFHTAYRRR